MIINENQIISNIEKCKQIIGKDKIYLNLRRYNPSKKSDLKKLKKNCPLLYSIALVDEQLKKSPGKIQYNDESILLQNLGRSLTVLRCNNVKGLDTDRLFKENLEKTAYEISIAAFFSRNGFNVEFIPERSDKTPDLLINTDTGIEVECKKKDQFTPHDNNNITFFERLCKDVDVIINNEQKNIVLILELDDYPKNNDLVLVKKILKSQIKHLDKEKYVFHKDGILLILNQTEPYDKILNIPIADIPTTSISGPNIPVKDILRLNFALTKSNKYYEKCGFSSDKLKHFHQTTKITHQIKGDNIYYHNPRILAYNCKQTPDRVKSIIKSIEKAKNQLSGNKPSIIFVDHNIYDNKTAETDTLRLKPMIDNILNNNTKISAIVITQEFKYNIKDGFKFEHKAITFVNRKAKNPIDEQKINNLLHMKY